MSDSFDNLWVDVSFLESGNDYDSTIIDFTAADSDNIGIYTMPIVYKNSEALDLYISTVSQYVTVESTDGSEDLNSEYFVFTEPMQFTILSSLTEYTVATSTISGSLGIKTLYSTSYGNIYGANNLRVNFISGNEYYGYLNNEIYYRTKTQLSGISDFEIVYTNFSGNLFEPVLTTDITKDVFYTTSSGSKFYENALVDISFAGWVEFGLLSDLWSTIVSTTVINTETDVMEGGLLPNYTEVCSSVVSEVPLNSDLYSSIEDYCNLNSECNTISGGLYGNSLDLYSTIDSRKFLSFNVDLFSLKITNFSLDVGDYTNSYNTLSVDILDDECLVSVSGTHLMVNDRQVDTTMSGIADGYRMFYDPTDDYYSLTGPTTFTVHAENECGKVLEQMFYLTFGYVVGFDNIDNPEGIDYGFGNKVTVRVAVENFASCPVTNSLAFNFESRNRYNTNLSASITGVVDTGADSQENLSAQIFPKSTAYFYGKEFEVLVNVKDFAGNEMEPLLLVYKIEDKP